MTEPTARIEPVASNKDTVPLDRSRSEFGEPATRPARSKRQRRIGWVIAAIILVGLIVLAWIIGDNLARDYATTHIKEQVVELLALPSDDGVAVDIGEGSVLLQAALGGLNEVTVTVEELSFGELTGALVLAATKVPLDTTKPVDELRVRFSVTEANVAKLGSFLSGSELNSITLAEPEIRIASEFSFFGLFSVPVGVGLTPSAVDGQLSFAPTTVTLGTEDMSVEELRSGQFGGLAEAFLASQSFCVAQYLPRALVVNDADVVGNDLVIRIEGDGTALSDPALSTLGNCE